MTKIDIQIEKQLHLVVDVKKVFTCIRDTDNYSSNFNVNWFYCNMYKANMKIWYYVSSSLDNSPLTISPSVTSPLQH